MTLDLNQMRPANYVKPGFFQAEHLPRPGTDGLYALALAYRLKDAGVPPQEFAADCEQLAQSAEQEYDSPEVHSGTRATVSSAGDAWRERCPALADFFQLAAGTLSDGKSVAALVVHLSRIENQLALLWSLAKADPASPTSRAQ